MILRVRMTESNNATVFPLIALFHLWVHGQLAVSFSHFPLVLDSFLSSLCYFLVMNYKHSFTKECMLVLNVQVYFRLNIGCTFIIKCHNQIC